MTGVQTCALPIPNGGFYEKKVDTNNVVVYNTFLEGMSQINELLKQIGRASCRERV